MAGLSGALAGLSNIFPGYTKGRKDIDAADIADTQVDDAHRSALAKIAMGNALSMLSQGGGGGAPGMGAGAPGPAGPQPPMPGMPSQPQGGMQGGGGPAPMGPGAMNAGPPQPMQPPRPPPQMAPQPMQPPGMGGGAPGMQGPPPGPPQGGGMPSLQGMSGLSSAQPRPGALDWRSLVQAVKQSNPNIKPDVMAEAVNQFLPMMSQQSQQEWRQLSLQIREQSLQDRERQVIMLEQGRNNRFGQGEEGKTTRTGMQQEGATARAGMVSGDKQKARDQRQQQFETRETRLQESLKLREDSTYQRLEQQKQAAAERVKSSNAKQGLAEWRAKLDEQYKYLRAKITTSSFAVDKNKQKGLLKELDDQHAADIKAMRDQAGQSTPGGGVQDAPGPKTQDSAAPKAGDVRDGYRFKGGNPADEKSWEKVK